LQGAFELHNGVPTSGGLATASPDTIRAMPREMLFDCFGVRLEGPKAVGKKLTINIDFTSVLVQHRAVKRVVVHAWAASQTGGGRAR
jgi:alkyl sulfatase BDS1-like metallo-beta-lactamase superfamily hydrolase